MRYTVQSSYGASRCRGITVRERMAIMGETSLGQQATEVRPSSPTITRWRRSRGGSGDRLHAKRELHHQRDTLEMIALENFVPRTVLGAVGSVLTKEYAEGCPGERYYGGCDEVDVAERLNPDNRDGAR